MKLRKRRDLACVLQGSLWLLSWEQAVGRPGSKQQGGLMGKLLKQFRWETAQRWKVERCRICFKDGFKNLLVDWMWDVREREDGQGICDSQHRPSDAA